MIILKEDKLLNYLDNRNFNIENNFINYMELAYLFGLPPIMFFLVPEGFKELTGFLLGINSAYFLISIKRFPLSPAGPINKILAVIFTLVVFVCFGMLVTILINLLNSETGLLLFMKGTFITFSGIYFSFLFIAKQNRN